MAILTHGSDLTLAPTLGPVVRQGGEAGAGSGGTVRGAVEVLARAGFRAVQLDATLAGIRPAELDRRARQDLAAMLGRQSMMLAGIDVFIPRRHFVDAAQVDRAMAAVLGAIALAAALGRVPVSLALPVAALGTDARAALVEAADGRGVRLAVHAEDQADALRQWVEQVDMPALGAGVDAAAVLGQGGDPVAAVHQWKGRLAVARLSDLDSPTAGGVRCAAGEGELDVAGYRIAVDLAAGRAGPVVLDLRGLANPLAAALRGKEAWDGAATRL
jgi:sugar phosphate isomerase/epimerase